jgi:hypothetical protein
MPLMAKERADQADDMGTDGHENPVVSFRPDPALRAVLQSAATRRWRGVSQADGDRPAFAKSDA